MINIRHGLFETNSSSVHSLVIHKNDWLNESYCTKSYVIKGGYYGRSPQLPFDDIEGKLNYIWTMVEGLYGWDYDYNKSIDKKNFKWELKIRNPEKYLLWQNMLYEICPNIKLVPISPGNWDVGIDHVYELENFAKEVEKNPELLKYLLLSYSWISVAGDEYPSWENLLPYPWGKLTKINDYTFVYMKGN